MTAEGTLTAPLRPSWRWRAGAWVATLAGVLLFGYVVAHWGWVWLAPASPPAPAAPAPERWAPVIIASPLFGRSAAPAPTEPAVLQGDTRLLGVFAAGNGTGHALFRIGDRALLLQPGQELAGDVTLVEVRPDGVRIRDHGEMRTIVLRADLAAAQPAPGSGPAGVAAARPAPGRGPAGVACAVPKGYTGPVFRLNAELLTGIASRPDGWSALLMPVPGGLAVRDGSAFAAMLGMKAGDRVTQANGIALTGIDDVLVAFVKPLVASQPVRVAGVRDGKPAAWLFLNAGACPG
jgi:hypothetical protein